MPVLAGGSPVNDKRFKHLLSPIQIGPLTIRNRVLSSGHGTSFATDGLPNDRHLYYHAERAKILAEP